ncbi:hypothetical protein [Chitinophaga rhizophila]|uniref:Lipocalin-like domain-containing protein n=1 Tax=Chitinophaga rhizophila TaxID=2866212 RepID=A0ABS7GJQ0_9BACT|nr:hypothetical protein [Chitinophaga rhizophila]MBW8686882.1 hypothetical protein [Chitinophaga rhizophila]
MKKILVPAILLLAACKKEDTTVNRSSYEGKWYINQITDKEYFLENGDTTFTKFNVANPGSTDFIDFQVGNQGRGDVVMESTYGSYTFPYEAVTQSFFKMDGRICEITNLNDSSLHFNSLHFDPVTIEDKILVRQTFYSLKR